MAESHRVQNETYVNATGVAIWVTAAVVILAVLIGIVQVFFGLAAREQTRDKILGVTTGELAKATEGWNQRLGSYGVIDQGRDLYHVPIDRAMELVIEDYDRAASSPTVPAATQEGTEGAAPLGAPSEVPPEGGVEAQPPGQGATEGGTAGEQGEK